MDEKSCCDPIDISGFVKGMEKVYGGLMIAMFLVPNRFYGEDGHEIDMLGDDWEAKWRAALG